MWSFETDADFERDLCWMRELLDEHVLPLEVLDLDETGLESALAPVRGLVKDRGLWAAHLGRDLGGKGFGQVQLGLMNEVTGRSRLGALAFGTQAPDAGNSEILARFGTLEQRRELLEPLVDGRLRSAYAMTEPGAGADPTLLSTSARPDNDEWILNGRKYFITNAASADFIIVMAVTDPDAAPHERATQFIVPKDAAGLRILREIKSMEDAGAHDSRYSIESHSEVALDDVRVPDTARLGAVGQGFTIAQERLGPGRIQHCMRWIGQASRALDMMCERSLYRWSQGSTLAEKQSVQNFIADSWTQLNAMRLMTLQAAWMIDRSGARSARKEISAIKFFGAEALHDIIDRAVQVHGAMGYSADLPLESMYRYARGARLYDGPDEVHRQVVARLVLRDYQAPADGMPTEHVPSRRDRAILTRQSLSGSEEIYQ